jgi:DNA-binding NtrC family response regulator
VIRVPALRERPGDIPILAHLFLVQFADEIPAFRGKRLADSALEMLRDYAFPGNVRELKNIIERAAYRDTTNEITPEDIGLLPRSLPTGQGGSFKARVSAFRRELIENALRETGGNQAEAARRLGLSYDQFRHYHRKQQSS